MARGNERKRIYRQEEDYLEFMGLLRRMQEQFEVKILADVLMWNHYHLISALL